MYYKTIRQAVSAEHIVKKSKFIAVLTPMSQIQDVEKTLQEVQQQYPGANHYCFSYIVRQDGSILERCSDDGEPNGTAGWPILNVLKNKELENIMAVVVRFFGGTLLGTGGLVKAYTRAVQAALDKAPIIQMEYSQKLMVSLDYSHYGSFQNQFFKLLNQLNNIEYTDLVNLELWIAVDKLESFIGGLNKLTGGKAKIEYREKDFVPIL